MSLIVSLSEQEFSCKECSEIVHKVCVDRSQSSSLQTQEG
jgi:hypothetical protein